MARLITNVCDNEKCKHSWTVSLKKDGSHFLGACQKCGDGIGYPVPWQMSNRRLLEEVRKLIQTAFNVTINQWTPDRGGPLDLSVTSLQSTLTKSCSDRLSALRWEWSLRYGQGWLEDTVGRETIVSNARMEGLRTVVIKMADDEWTSNTDMTKLAADFLYNDDGNPAYPAIVSVYEHAGWSLGFALISGKVRVVASANDRAQWSSDVEWFRKASYNLAFDRENSAVIDRNELKKCDSEPRDASVFTCNSLDCPVHGARNRDLLR